MKKQEEYNPKHDLYGCIFSIIGLVIVFTILFIAQCCEGHKIKGKVSNKDYVDEIDTLTWNPSLQLYEKYKSGKIYYIDVKCDCGKIHSRPVSFHEWKNVQLGMEVCAK